MGCDINWQNASFNTRNSCVSGDPSYAACIMAMGGAIKEFLTSNIIPDQAVEGDGLHPDKRTGHFEKLGTYSSAEHRVYEDYERATSIFGWMGKAIHNSSQKSKSEIGIKGAPQDKVASSLIAPEATTAKNSRINVLLTPDTPVPDNATSGG